MSRFWPALKFAFWTYFWTLGFFEASILALQYSERWRNEEQGLAWWHGFWDDLQGSWFLPLPIFLAALLAFWLAPRWGKGLTLLLTPLFLAVWFFRFEQVGTDEVIPFMLLILPAALLASVPDFIRSRRSRVA